MTFTRWKVMAGVLGVSIGGLAAFAGQCPKPGDAHQRSRRADDAPKLPDEALKLPAPGTGPAAPALPAVKLTLDAPVIAPPPPGVKAPDLPTAAPLSPPVVKAPDLAPPLPQKAVVLPEVPAPTDLKAAPPLAPPAVVIPAGGTALPAIPSGPAVEPPKPALPEPLPTPDNTKAPPTGVTFNPAPSAPPSGPTSPPVPLTPPKADPLVVPPSPSTDPLIGTPPVRQQPTPDAAPPRHSTPTPPAAAPAAAKFRIILRVGEGEPMFEVRQGDDLMMKVVCEKVDIKSPEKGTGPSAVTATGKVRFVGFGAEGTCDQLSFMAGTGEVAMNGAVKIQVKDKLGRVESELTSDKMHYKLDASALPGSMKP